MNPDHRLTVVQCFTHHRPQAKHASLARAQQAGTRLRAELSPLLHFWKHGAWEETRRHREAVGAARWATGGATEFPCLLVASRFCVDFGCKPCKLHTQPTGLGMWTFKIQVTIQVSLSNRLYSRDTVLGAGMNLGHLPLIPSTTTAKHKLGD
jgi:hypothetical protein